MNAEQRQRASQLVRSQTEEEAIGEAFAMLQELIDTPEPEPVGEAVDFNGWRIVRWTGKESSFPLGTKFYTAPPAKNQSEQHLEMVNPQPASVPDWLETTRFLTDVTTAAGLLEHGRRDKGLAQRIGDFVYKYRMLEARRNGSEITRNQPLETLKWPPTSEPCRRCAAFEGLTKAQEAQISNHREQADKYREAITTLDSEHEANRLLTEQRDKLLDEMDAMKETMRYMRIELEKLRTIEAAALVLQKAKGRHNSELAMNKLLEALKRPRNTKLSTQLSTSLIVGISATRYPTMLQRKTLTGYMTS